MTDFRIKSGQYTHKQQYFRKVIPQDTAVKSPLSQQDHAAQRTLDLDSGIGPYSGSFDQRQRLHLLKRTLFGVKRETLRNFAGLDLQATISQLLQVDPDPDPPVNNYNSFLPTGNDPDVPTGVDWTQAPFNEEVEGGRILSLKAWMIRNILAQPSTIHEKMIFFWHNLLPIQVWSVFVGKAAYKYVTMLRNNALGNFKTIIRDLTLDPAMLIYLNGASNSKEAPDENYARELQELFCIGKGPNAQFTETDVQAAARVLTGLTIYWDSFITNDSPRSYFEPLIHDTSDKQFSAFYNNRVIKGLAGGGGLSEMDELLDMIFENDETAFYLARRLYNFFVYSTISSSAEEKVIAPLAQTIRENNFEIEPALRQLLASEHFYDNEIIGAVIKNPLDHVIGTWKTLEMPEPDDEVEQVELRLNLMWSMAITGLEIGDPPSVAGWPAYYQIPNFDNAWITTDSILKRAVTVDSMLLWGYGINESTVLTADLIHVLEQLDEPHDPFEMIKELSILFTGIELSDLQAEELKDILLSGQENENYWTSAWNGYQQDKTNMQLQNVILTRLKPTVQKMLQLGEAQLM